MYLVDFRKTIFSLCSAVIGLRQTLVVTWCCGARSAVSPPGYVSPGPEGRASGLLYSSARRERCFSSSSLSLCFYYYCYYLCIFLSFSLFPSPLSFPSFISPFPFPHSFSSLALSLFLSLSPIPLFVSLPFLYHARSFFLSLPLNSHISAYVP